jgi:Transposon-encoded protein TnpV
MDIQSKFASRRKTFLAQRYPAVYADLVKSGTLEASLETTGRDAKRLFNRIMEHNKAQIEAIEDPEKRQIKQAQIELMAEEVALAEAVLTL